MNLFRRWFWPRSVRNEVLWLYRLGMACTEREDAKGALSAYTSAIEHPDSPDDVKAMALYNRALLFTGKGNADKALVDLQAIIEIPIPLHGVKLAAKRRLERLQHRQEVATRPSRRSTS
jgi:hypothetical protein